MAQKANHGADGAHARAPVSVAGGVWRRALAVALLTAVPLIVAWVLIYLLVFVPRGPAP